MPAVPLDPSHIAPARWANRHDLNLRGKPFESLKASIDQHGGNVVPILVRRVGGESYEIVYGRRRCQACAELGLRVNAVVWQGELSDVDHFLLANSENRMREDPSVYEQGVSYLAALSAGLFPSRRALAEACGVSHTWVNKAIAVAELPASIVDICTSPTRIQPRHAQALMHAIGRDGERVIERAAALEAQGVRLAPDKLVDTLTDEAASTEADGEIAWRGVRYGGWRIKRRRLLITVDAVSTSEETARRVASAVARALGVPPKINPPRELEATSLQLRLDE